MRISFIQRVIQMLIFSTGYFRNEDTYVINFHENLLDLSHVVRVYQVFLWIHATPYRIHQFWNLNISSASHLNELMFWIYRNNIQICIRVPLIHACSNWDNNYLFLSLTFTQTNRHTENQEFTVWVKQK